MPYVPWGDHRGGRLELALLPRCGAPDTDPFADPPRDGEGCLSIEAGDFHLPLHKLPEFTGTLYEAAGQPVPVILPRSQLGGNSSIFLGGYSVHHDGTAVTVMVGTGERRLTPGEAREWAAAIAQRADEADTGKAETEALADLIYVVTGNRHESLHVARSLLAAGYGLRERTP